MSATLCRGSRFFLNGTQADQEGYVMRKSELDRLLETAVAEALGLAPRRAKRPVKQSKQSARSVRRPAYGVEQHVHYAAH